MKYHVAPGEDGYNLLSKRHLFRVVILNGMKGDDDSPIKGPMVLEATDGSYIHEIDFADAVKKGGTLVFEFHVKLRKKDYHCYIKDASRKFKWDLLPIGMVNEEHFESAEEDKSKKA